MTPLVPLHGGRGPEDWQQSSISVLPFLGTFLLLLLLATLVAAYLWRQGRLTVPALRGPRSPEDEARHILAERFARGDLSSEEFLERASMLNWTPGSDSVSPRPHKRRP